MSTFLSLVSGAIGGNFAASIFRSLNIGFAGNLIAGMFGGLAAGYLLESVAPETPDLGSLMTATLGSVFGGGATVCVVGLIRNLLKRR